MNIIWHRFPQALIDTDLGKKKQYANNLVF